MAGYNSEFKGYQPEPSHFQGYTNPLGFSGQSDYNYNWADPMWQQFFHRLKEQGVEKLGQQPGIFGGTETLPSTYDPESQTTSLTRPSNQLGTGSLRGLLRAAGGR